MASKKLKLLSGLLSFTAIASMTGAPVLANEFLHNPLSGSETQDTEEAQKSLSILTEDTEEAASGSISQFIEQENEDTPADPAVEETQEEEDGGQKLIVLSDTEVTDEKEEAGESDVPEDTASVLDDVIESRCRQLGGNVVVLSHGLDEV